MLVEHGGGYFNGPRRSLDQVTEPPHSGQGLAIQGQGQPGAFGPFDKELNTGILGHQMGREPVDGRRRGNAQAFDVVDQLAMQRQAMARGDEQAQPGRRRQQAR